MMMTDPIMIALATAMRAFNTSPANNQPRKTATTGFTYAYVENSDTGALWINQPYATNPTSDPNVMRYSSPHHERIETSPKLNPFNSPVATLTMNSDTEPASICMPVDINVDLGISAPRA